MHRRHLLAQGLALAAGAPLARLSFAQAGAPSRERPLFVWVILRGGLDGLWAAPPVGDTDFAAARGALAAYPDAPPLPLDGFFALHPALAEAHAMYGRGELRLLQAVGLPYHERSHFDAQQVLESGGERPYQLASGWLARALAAGRRAVALSTAPPLALRGAGNAGIAVDTWAPSALPDPAPDLLQRLAGLYRDDAPLAAALARAQGLRDEGMAAMPADDGSMAVPRGGRRQTLTLARKAAEFLAQPAGPDIAVLEMGGWDSHAGLATPNNGYASNLRALDEALAALRETLAAPAAGGAWRRCAVLVTTEFGRAVAINGTQGSDHGSGGAALLLGGAVAGGRVSADWPGLAPRQRFEGRDLRGTTDLRAVFKAVLGDHLRIARATLDREVFPGAAAVAPLAGLLRGAG